MWQIYHQAAKFFPICASINNSKQWCGGKIAIAWIKRKLVVCLSKGGLVRRMSTGNEAWSLFNKTLTTKNCIAKCRFPYGDDLPENLGKTIVHVRDSKTSLLKVASCRTSVSPQTFFRPLQRFSSDWDDRDGQVNCTEIRIHTSGGPIIEYMRKKWKYCCRWRPCSGTSFFNRPSTAVKIWSLSVALLSSSAKQTNKESITTNSREILRKNKKPFKQNFALSHQSVRSITTAQVCVSLATNVQAQAAVPNCIGMGERWHLQAKLKSKLWSLLIFGFTE